jgi:hypothetical protein
MKWITKQATEDSDAGSTGPSALSSVWHLIGASSYRVRVNLQLLQLDPCQCNFALAGAFWVGSFERIPAFLFLFTPGRVFKKANQRQRSPNLSILKPQQCRPQAVHGAEHSFISELTKIFPRPCQSAAPSQ